MNAVVDKCALSVPLFYGSGRGFHHKKGFWRSQLRSEHTSGVLTALLHMKSVYQASIIIREWPTLAVKYVFTAEFSPWFNSSEIGLPGEL